MSKTFRAVSAIAFAAAALSPGIARADQGFPDYVKLPPQIQPAPDQKLAKETFGEAEFAIDQTGSNVEAKRGLHYARWFAYKPAAGEPAPGYYNGTEERIFKAMQAPLAQAGWKLVFADENKSRFVMRLQKDGKDVWAAVKMDAPQAQVNLEIIESGGSGPGLVLPSPAARPERIADKDDLPYLPPFPGSTRKSVGRGDGPLDIAEPGKGGEAQLVGTSVVTRSYQGPSSLSKLQFVGDYRKALLAAGWTVFYPADEKQVNDHAGVVAHYAQNGRDIWAKLDYEYGANLSYSVVDLGAEDWSAKLDRDCRVPLYGVFFDFNKATLKRDSDAALTKVAALLQAKPSLAVEVQGHTDNIGGDDYNNKLSDARAASVRQWLTQHGVAAQRLTSKGYGKSQPVADNGSDEGRAKNRRVEIARPGCRK